MTQAAYKLPTKPKPLVLPYPPTLNHLYANVRGRKVLTKAGRIYKATAGYSAIAAGLRPLEGEVTVIIDIFRPRKSGDLDNFFKVAFDALKGIAWHDDKQVRRIVAERDDDKANPRVEVQVLPYTGRMP